MTAEIFTKIYEENHWENSESRSGSGSTIDATKILREALPELLTNLNIKSILDIPCGDFNWMNEVDLTGIDYVGADVVPELINENVKQYGTQHKKFKVLDLLRDQLPKADLVICRDCLVHFSFEDAFTALEKICSSGAKYLLTTTFPLHQNTEGIETGWWYPINLNDAPFPLPEPLLLLNEGCQEPYFWDKCVGLWRMN